MRRFLRLLPLLVLCSGVLADVRLPHVFGSHMVLQRDQPLAVWGWADAGEEVKVALAEQAPVKATADAAGKWQVTLPKQSAGGPLTLKVAGKNELVLDDVLVGDVWVCSGQSNMEWVVRNCTNVAPDIAAADLPTIRQLHMPYIPAGSPVADRDARWEVCSPATVGGFTACGFFMARKLAKDLGVPVGLLHTSWGGTRIEPWCTPASFGEIPELKGIYNQIAATQPQSPVFKAKLGDYLKALELWTGKAKDALTTEQSLDLPPAFPNEIRPLHTLDSPMQQPSTLYHGMVHPLVPYNIRGAIWYQGESNHGEGKLYTLKMKALIEGWRKIWHQPDLPFYFVQIAPFNYGAEPPAVLAEFWEAQAEALAIPNTGMVVTYDIGNYNDIHPRNKQEVGRRLALLALKGTYGKTDTVADGPTFKSLTPEGDKLRVTFDNVGAGLVSRDGKPLSWFEVIGEDTDFEQADAVIDGASVLLSSPKVPKPLAMRFGWAKNAEPNLSNKDGLPARAFRAGDVPKRDYLTKVAEAKGFTLLYDLDLAKLAHDIKYDVDASRTLKGEFDRVGYFVELSKPGVGVQYVWVSLDAFTKELSKLGIPTLASQAKFQQKVANANIVSNVPGIVNGTGLATCNLEFWPHNYAPANEAGIPGASDGVWDFGDQIQDPEDGYGSMQIHNFGAKQTLFAINHWVAGGNADLGFGNWDGKNPDWTFATNAGTYTTKRLRVLVHMK